MNQKMKSILHVALAVALLFSYPRPAQAARFNRTITITAGTPIQLATIATPVSRIFIQAAVGGTGVVYVMDGIPVGVTPSHTNSGQLTAQLAPATASSPGGSYSDNGPAIDLQRIWIDGSVNSDPVIVSYNTVQ